MTFILADQEREKIKKGNGGILSKLEEMGPEKKLLPNIENISSTNPSY